MYKENGTRPLIAQRGSGVLRDADLQEQWRRVLRRQSFGQVLGLRETAAPPANGFLADSVFPDSGPLSNGDVAILRFLGAVELIESDLWQQYNELSRVEGGNAAFSAALSNLDSDLPQHIADSTEDEISHAAFLNAYLRAQGEPPANLDAFRALPSSQATGAEQIGRLTNLQSLDVDTGWYVRYRSTQNPDLGAMFPQAVTIRREPAIPVNDTETPPENPALVPPVGPQQVRMQAIANTAAFHLAYIEQAASSLYSIMALKARNLEVLRIIVSIGVVEANHFSLSHDKARNAVAQPLAGVTDPQTGATFPDLGANGGTPDQTDRILPEPCTFLHPSLPPCSIARPTLGPLGGAVAIINSFTSNRLFEGQPPKFFKNIHNLARQADAASRGAI